jgi:hypothetical protein
MHAFVNQIDGLAKQGVTDENRSGKISLPMVRITDLCRGLEEVAGYSAIVASNGCLGLLLNPDDPAQVAGLIKLAFENEGERHGDHRVVTTKRGRSFVHLEVPRPDGSVVLAILTPLDLQLFGDSRQLEMRILEHSHPFMQ